MKQNNKVWKSTRKGKKNLKRDLIKRSLSIFLVVTMVFSIILHAKITAHADEVHSNVITKANITDLEGKCLLGKHLG